MLTRTPRQSLVTWERAKILALIVPALLLGGAFAFEHVGGLHPCEMCYWQRWPHAAAILLAAAGLAMPRAERPLILLAAIAIAVSGAIGVFHVGVEQGWWEGITTCATSGSGTTDPDALLEEIMNAPVIRCDQVQWSFVGVSMAGWNALISLGSAALILVGVVRGSAR